MIRAPYLLGSVALIGLLWSSMPASSQSNSVEGSLQIDDEAIPISHVTVHEQAHPFEEGETVYLLTLSEQEIPYLEVDDTCPGEYGNRSIQLKIDRQQETLMTNYCFVGGNSSGQTFDLDLGSSGPPAFKGSVAADFEVFDSRISFDIAFRAQVPDTLPGELLPAGGGEPGAAYTSWNAAIKSGDIERIKTLLPPDQAEGFDAMPIEEQMENLEFLQLMAPSDVEVLGGRLVDDLAYLDVTATMDGEPVKGEVKLQLAEGKWLAVKESW